MIKFLIIALMVSLWGCQATDPNGSGSENQDKSEAADSNSPSIALNDAYEQVTLGMTLEQVEALLGKGAVGNSQEALGFEDTEYWWIWAGDEGMLTIKFKEDSVISKSRSGSKQKPEIVASDVGLSASTAYERIQGGATLAEVEELLGKGYEVSSHQTDGGIIFSYDWYWPNDQGRIGLTVREGTIRFKSFTGPKN